MNNYPDKDYKKEVEQADKDEETLGFLGIALGAVFWLIWIVYVGKKGGFFDRVIDPFLDYLDLPVIFTALLGLVFWAILLLGLPALVGFILSIPAMNKTKEKTDARWEKKSADLALFSPYMESEKKEREAKEKQEEDDGKYDIL